eukprot:GHVN01001089.1.p1 GENE.GHVN01001089.1~~GHVN01001089.1.p1  ORF type:complete len:899 (-),score=74.52 GHVN01001089.1:73-2688(-)
MQTLFIKTFRVRPQRLAKSPAGKNTPSPEPLVLDATTPPGSFSFNFSPLRTPPRSTDTGLTPPATVPNATKGLTPSPSMKLSPIRVVRDLVPAAGTTAFNWLPRPPPHPYPNLQNKLLSCRIIHSTVDATSGGSNKKDLVGTMASTETALPKLQGWRFGGEQTAVGSMGDPHEVLPLTTEEMLNLCDDVVRMFKAEDSVVQTSTPVVIFGDLHGQVRDLQKFLNSYGWPLEINNIFSRRGYFQAPVGDPDSSFDDSGGTPKKFVFLGNIVGKGGYSVECVALIFALKVLFPSVVYLLRGNHEDPNVNIAEGFRDECLRKFEPDGQVVWERVNDVFEFLPIGAKIDQDVFCLHGGLGATLLNVSDLQGLRKPIVITNLANLVTGSQQDRNVVDAVWSKIQGPLDVSHISTFRLDSVARFNDQNGLHILVRSNECMPSGFEVSEDFQLITIASATKQSKTCQNDAAILEISKALLAGNYGRTIINIKVIEPDEVVNSCGNAVLFNQEIADDISPANHPLNFPPLPQDQSNVNQTNPPETAGVVPGRQSLRDGAGMCLQRGGASSAARWSMLGPEAAQSASHRETQQGGRDMQSANGAYAPTPFPNCPASRPRHAGQFGSILAEGFDSSPSFRRSMSPPDSLTQQTAVTPRCDYTDLQSQLSPAVPRRSSTLIPIVNGVASPGVSLTCFSSTPPHFPPHSPAHFLEGFQFHANIPHDNPSPHMNNRATHSTGPCHASALVHGWDDGVLSPMLDQDAEVDELTAQLEITKAIGTLEKENSSSQSLRPSHQTPSPPKPRATINVTKVASTSPSATPAAHMSPTLAYGLSTFLSPSPGPFDEKLMRTQDFVQMLEGASATLNGTIANPIDDTPSSSM